MKKYLPFFICIMFLLFVYGLPSTVNTQYTHVYAATATQSAALSVSARIKPTAADFQLGFTSDHPTNTVGADEEIEYTITYGSKIDYGTPMTITAKWSLGQVPTESLYSYSIVSYVAGSATNDYWGKSVPVVDMAHRTITWTVDRFPPNTIDKTLRFRLRTAGRYVTDKNVNYSVTATMTADDVTLDPIVLEQTYMPSEFIKKEIKGMQILAAEVRQVTDTSFSLYVVTSVPTKATILYGTSPDALDKSLTDGNLVTERLMTVIGLYPATKYYYKILIESEKGVQKKTPEIFSVTTASTSLISLIDLSRVLLTSRGVLLNNTVGLGFGTSILVPSSVPVETYLPFKRQMPHFVYVSFINRRVLGITTETALATSDQKVRLLETQLDTYTGAITAPSTPGIYDMMIEAVSEDGTVSSDVLATLIVSTPIIVKNEDGNPVEAAIVYLERFNRSLGAYEYFPAQTFGSHNPAVTKADGTTEFILPEGNYTLNVNAIGYKTYQKPFAFNPSGSAPYPSVTLITSPFSFFTYIRYYGAVAIDSLRFFNYSIDQLSESKRFVDLGLVVGVFILSILSFFSNLQRIRLSLESLFIKLERRIRHVLGKQKTDNLYIGFVEQTNQLPVHGAIITVSLKKTHTIVARDVTNGLGEFHVRIYPGMAYEMTVRKPGYDTVKVEVPADALFVIHSPIQLDQTVHAKLPVWISFPWITIKTMAIGLSDALLFGVGILNLLLYVRVGVLALPVMVVTAVNAYLWIQFHWHSYHASMKKRSDL